MVVIEKEEAGLRTGLVVVGERGGFIFEELPVILDIVGALQGLDVLCFLFCFVLVFSMIMRKGDGGGGGGTSTIFSLSIVVCFMLLAVWMELTKL